MLDAVEQVRHGSLVTFQPEFSQAVDDGIAAAMATEHQFNALGPHAFRTEGEIGVRVLQESILMNAGLCREDRSPADRLIRGLLDSGQALN